MESPTTACTEAGKASRLTVRYDVGDRMCGRYVRRSEKQKIAEYFHANPQPAELPLPGEDYNIAPTTFQPITLDDVKGLSTFNARAESITRAIRQSRESGDREMALARWGLVPFFTKTTDVA